MKSSDPHLSGACRRGDCSRCDGATATIEIGPWTDNRARRKRCECACHEDSGNTDDMETTDDQDRLLREDAEPIKVVPAAPREAWQPKPTGYTREQYEKDKRARERNAR